MARAQDDSGHRLALPAVMVAIFLASVAVAALLVHRRSGPVDRGAEILRAIRSRGLPSYWGARQEVLWYLQLDPRGRPAGWRVVSRAPAEDGYVGRKILVGQQIYVEHWQINNAATAGRYSGNLTTGMIPSTNILLDRGNVTVVRSHGGRMVTASDPAPGNYVPEGLNSLALSLAAAGGEKAIFRMVYNEQAIVGNRVYFSMAIVEPVTPRRVHVTYEMLEGDTHEMVEFDAKGQVEGGEDLDTHHTFRRVSLADLIKVYPEAKRYAERLFDAEASQPATEPAEEL